MAEPEGEDPSPGRGALSRLRRRMTKASAPAPEPNVVPVEAAAQPTIAHPTDADDEGWVHHESEGGTGFTGWLYHYADGTMSAEDGTVYEHTQSGPAIDPTPDPEPEPEPEPEEPEPDGEESSQIPGFVEYTPSEVRSYVLGAVLVLASVGAVLTLFLVAPDPDLGGLLLAACLGVVAAVVGWALSSWTPTIVSIREGVLELAHGRRIQHFDLRDPDTRVELGRQPGSPSWRTTVTSPDGHTAVIGARQVKARHFTEIVEYHRSRQRRREEPAGTATPDDSR